MSGPHKYISPEDLEDYMGTLSFNGSGSSPYFYDKNLVKDLIQLLNENKKQLQIFAEKLDFAANQFEEKDMEESEFFGLME